MFASISALMPYRKRYFNLFFFLAEGSSLGICNVTRAIDLVCNCLSVDNFENWFEGITILFWSEATLFSSGVIHFDFNSILSLTVVLFISFY